MSTKRGAATCCDTQDPSVNMDDVGERKKPALSVQLEPEEVQWMRLMQKYVQEKNRSELGRALMKLGATVLLQDPDMNIRRLSWPEIPGQPLAPQALHHAPPADDTNVVTKELKAQAAEADRLDRSEAQTELDSPAAREAAGKPKRRAKK